MNKNDCCTKKQDQKIQDITSNSHFSLMYYFASTPIKKPCVNEDFQDLTIVSKVVECLRYNFLYFEYFLSPKGSLRHLFKINILLTLAMLFVLLPIITLINLARKQVFSLQGLIVETSDTLFIIIKLFGYSIAFIFFVYFIWIMKGVIISFFTLIAMFLTKLINYMIESMSKSK